MSDFNFAPDRWEFWRELPDPDDAQYDAWMSMRTRRRRVRMSFNALN